MTAVERLGYIEIRGGSTPAQDRLTYVRDLIDRRLQAASPGLLPPQWQDGPAFEVHIMSGLEDVLSATECRLALKYIVLSGEQAHVVVFLHEPLEHVAALLAGVSPGLSAYLMAGRSLRHISIRPVARP